MSSPAFSLNKSDGLKILKVAGYSIASIVVSALISLIAEGQFDPKYAAMIPVINSILYSTERYLTDHTQEATTNLPPQP